MRGLPNAQTKIPNTASEPQIRRRAGGLCRYCCLQQQKSPGPISGLHHITAPGTKDPLDSFLRREHGRSDFLRRRSWLLVAENPTANAGFHRPILHDALVGDGTKCVIGRCRCALGRHRCLGSRTAIGDNDFHGCGGSSNVQTETNSKAVVLVLVSVALHLWSPEASPSMRRRRKSQRMEYHNCWGQTTGRIIFESTYLQSRECWTAQTLIDAILMRPEKPILFPLLSKLSSFRITSWNKMQINLDDEW